MAIAPGGHLTWMADKHERWCRRWAEDYLGLAPMQADDPG